MDLQAYLLIRVHTYTGYSLTYSCAARNGGDVPPTADGGDEGGVAAARGGAELVAETSDSMEASAEVGVGAGLPQLLSIRALSGSSLQVV